MSTQCFQFHLYAGVRAGGGIGDELDDPSGDEREYARIIFDISFFFFVVVILLAIIQGMLKLLQQIYLRWIKFREGLIFAVQFSSKINPA